MWRNVTLAFFLFILAQTANATSKLNFDNETSIQPNHPLQTSPTSLDFSFANLDDDTPEEHANLPRLNRACSSSFSNEIQLTPNYHHAITFFEVKLSPALFKNLTNPGMQIRWFEKISHQSNSSRISGWQDSNALYASNITYYS
ncbi:MAG: hypothetical protein HRT53_07740 [Colwellia sp.]|nr:hypothetical protein [Colwellia sp.]